VPLLAVDFFARIIAVRIDASPLFGAFRALAIDDGGGGAGLSPNLLATPHIKRMMDSLQRAVVSPQVEIIVERALRRQVLGHIAPLASRAQHVHDPIHNFAHIDRLWPPCLAGSALRYAPIPRQSGHLDSADCHDCNSGGSRSSTSAAPPRIRPPPTLESQMIQQIQLLFGRTLKGQGSRYHHGDILWVEQLSPRFRPWNYGY
jgi:hypothetical protein